MRNLIVGSGVLIVGVIAVMSLAGDPAPAAPDEPAVVPLQTEQDAVYVPDQRPGSDIVGTLAVLSRTGFLAVRENDNGTMGDVIGVSALLGVGRNENFPLPLYRQAQEGERLYAMLYEDTNGDSIFTDGKDQPLLDATGSRVFVIFSLVKAE